MSDASDTPTFTDELIPPSVHQLTMLKRVVYLSAGCACIVLGVVFWLIPFVTGIPFYLLGLVFLARTSDRVRRAVNWCDRRLPHSLRKGLRWARERFGVAQMPRVPAPRADESDPTSIPPHGEPAKPAPHGHTAPP